MCTNALRNETRGKKVGPSALGNIVDVDPWMSVWSKKLLLPSCFVPLLNTKCGFLWAERDAEILITLHASPAQADGSATITCYDFGSTELATLAANSGHSLPEFKVALAEELNVPVQQPVLAFPDSSPFKASDGSTSVLELLQKREEGQPSASQCGIA